VTLRLSLLSLAALGGAAFLASAPAAATPQRELREIRCDMLENDRGRMITVEAPGLSVLSQTANDRQFAPAIPRGIAAISCGRTSVIPAAWDDKVIALGLPLFISDPGGRLGVLEIDNGRYRFRLIHGSTRPEEQAQIDQRVAQYQARFDAAQRQNPQRH
jgi:hypothetical protein